MILINLLPPDELKGIQFRQRKIPIVPSLFLIFFIIFLYWVGLIFSVTYLKSDIYKTVKELEKINPRRAEVDTVWDKLHNDLLVQKSCIETVMISRLKWSQVLNVISDYASQGIWLRRLDLERKNDDWILTIGGLAKPGTQRSMIKDIGTYVTNVKDSLEARLLRHIADGSDMRDYVEVSTTTKRKKAQTIELTEFTTTFKITL